MKKLFFFLLVVLSTTGFADTFLFKNQTSCPSKKIPSKMAIQWASSAKEVDEENKAVLHGKLNPDTLYVLDKAGTVKVAIPPAAAYFRVVVWSKDQEDPDLLTNWVDVVPNKTYTLKEDHLVPAVLMSGTGC